MRMALRPGRWPVTIRVALATACVMVLLGLVASRQVLSTLGRLQNERLQEFARLHVEGLAVALGPFALHRDVWEVYDTLDRARSNASVARILFTVVADDQGRVLAATDPTRAPVDSDSSTFAADAVPVGEVTALSGSSVVRVRAPLTVQGRDVGRIVAELDVSDLLAQRRTTTLALLTGNALATLILGLAGAFVVARILKPVELLTRHMGEAGGQPHPIPEAAIPRSDTVLAQLLRTFNDMAGAIDARAEAERRLAERERFVSLGRLSSSLAHEVNNPLGGLLNATDTIRAYADRPEVVRQSSELLNRGLHHLRDVSRAILEENRIDRSICALSPTDFEDLRLLFEPETNHREQQLHWEIEGGPAQFTDFPSVPVRQVALNLLLNASSAAPRGGSVGLTARAKSGALELTVTDDGPGLSEAARARLLSATPVEPGGGVGLRLVRDVVVGLGGEVRNDRVGAQTEITVRLPAKEKTPC